MIFNSIEFAIFFPIVFLLYWLLFCKTARTRNLYIILVSYFFYGIWDWRFLILIAISSLSDYLLGLQIHKSEDVKRRKLFLTVSVILNIGILGFFKYFNFFTDSFLDLFTLFGASFSYQRLSIILPVGISFYTFQTMSYTFDIYYKRLKPTKDPFAFFAFVSFFPQLVAGPIERAKDLLPQFYTIKTAEYSKIRSGMLIIALGLFKKIVIADRLAIYVDNVYSDVDSAQGLPMLMSAVFFAFQLYLDFSAYSDIAIGIARTLGFDLSTNFKRPYLAKSFSDFWNRWHISLSSWFRDYLYIPLGGNRNGKIATIKNIMIVFMVSGLWHGASWNFVIWGSLCGVFLIVLDKVLLKIKIGRIFNSFIIFWCWTLSLVFFRSTTLGTSVDSFSNLGFSNSEKLYEYGLNSFEFKLAICLLVGILLIEILVEKNKISIDWILSKPAIVRYVFYFSVVVTTILFGSYGVDMNDNNFIYFQF